MNPVAEAIEGASKSVFYAIAFRGAQTGPADKALDALDPKKMLVMGVANTAGKPKSQTLMVQLPGRGPIPFGPAALTKNLPEPFKAEWTGGGGIHMHHKFVICDFSVDNPVVFTGSSNLSAWGEEGNGDNLIEIRDRDAHDQRQERQAQEHGERRPASPTGGGAGLRGLTRRKARDARSGVGGGGAGHLRRRGHELGR